MLQVLHLQPKADESISHGVWVSILHILHILHSAWSSNNAFFPLEIFLDSSAVASHIPTLLVSPLDTLRLFSALPPHLFTARTCTYWRDWSNLNPSELPKPIIWASCVIMHLQVPFKRGLSGSSNSGIKGKHPSDPANPLTH